jgi:hypothetical protein
MGTEIRRGIAAVFVFATSLAAAQEVPKPAATAERAAMLASLPRGKQLVIRGAAYQQLIGVTAIERTGRATPEDAVASVGASPVDIVENKGKLVIFRAARKSTIAVDQRSGIVFYPTVLNPRNGVIGVLTGALVVKPKDIADADAIAAGHGLVKLKAYPQLGTVFYKVKAGADIADVSASVQADPRVESAYPEIVEHVRVPR